MEIYLIFFLQVKIENSSKPDESNIDNEKVKDNEGTEDMPDKSDKSDDEEEKENKLDNNGENSDTFTEEKKDENVNSVEEKYVDTPVKMETENNISNEKPESSGVNTDLKINITNSDTVDDQKIDVDSTNAKEGEKSKSEDCGKDDDIEVENDNNFLKCPDNSCQSEMVNSCNDVPQEKSKTENLSSNITLEVPCDIDKSEKLADNLLQPEVQPSSNVNDNTTEVVKPTENVPNNYDKIISIQTETKPYNDAVLSSKFKGEDSVQTEIGIFNGPSSSNDYPKTEMTVTQPVNEKQYESSPMTNAYCKTPDTISSNVKQYSGSALSSEYCKTDNGQSNVKQYGEALLNEYRKLDMIQPHMNKQIYNKEESVEYSKNSQVLPVSTNSSQEVFKSVGEQAKSKVSGKIYSHPDTAENTITVPKYDNIKNEKQSKKVSPSPKTLPYRLPSSEVPQVEKPTRVQDYLPPMGFVNYQKLNNSIAVGHPDISNIPKMSKDIYPDKKTDSVNVNLPKDKDVMNLPKSIDNSLLYSSVMQQSPYTDQSMMHLSLHHHLAHSSQYHHSPPVPAQVPPPVHQSKSRSKKSEQRRSAQQNQTALPPSTQQPSPSLSSHTQSYHHHQTASYMMPQPSPSSPYHHSVIQHRMGQQSGSCSSADFYLSHTNQLAPCNISKLQQMTNGLDHHRRHITSPAPSPSSSPANMTPPPPAASAAAAHLLQQSAVAYHKLYQQAGQTNQSRQYGHQSRGAPSSPNVGLMSMQYGAPPPPFNGYRVAPQSTPPSAGTYMNQTTGQLQYTTHSQDPHHQNGVYPASAYNGSYLQPLNGSMHR